MTERPILFSGPMVRAILAGRKTVTRRIVKPQPELRDEFVYWASPRYDNGDGVRYFHTDESSARQLMSGASPYGVPGDRLWVRETWRPSVIHTHGQDACDCADVRVRYDADGAEIDYRDEQIPDEWLMPQAARRGNVPGIHMPRWASRLTREVVSVGVERLQEISAADILAEGVVDRPHKVAGLSGDCPVSVFDGRVYPDLRSLWAAGWDSINAKRAPWSTNPWVWVVRFRRVER